jgi:hypothetical protein
LLADLVLVLHFALAAFIVCGIAAISLGWALAWGWVRNRSFRLAHLLAVCVVALEAILGIACPLTVLEDWLRGGPGERSFVARWVSRALYYDLPQWVFTTVYVAAAVATLLAWRLVSPRPRQRLRPWRGGESRSR